MDNFNNTYCDNLKKILEDGYNYQDPNRKGVYRKELPFVSLNHKVENGYPIVTTRKTYFKGAVGELLLFLKGSTDIRDYWEYGIRFWDSDWARFNNLNKYDVDELYSKWKINKLSEDSPKLFNMGKIYGYQYNKQINIFDRFKDNPLRTDLIINSWQVDDLSSMCLIPCHYSFQMVGNSDSFYITWNQRSTDYMLGTPINVQFYYLLGVLLEIWSGYKFLGVQGNLNKVHLYDNQLELAHKMLDVHNDNYNNNTPKLNIDIGDVNTETPFSEFIKNIVPNMFKLEGYSYHIDNKVPMLTYNN